MHLPDDKKHRTPIAHHISGTARQLCGCGSAMLVVDHVLATRSSSGYQLHVCGRVFFQFVFPQCIEDNKVLQSHTTQVRVRSDDCGRQPVHFAAISFATHFVSLQSEHRFVFLLTRKTGELIGNGSLIIGPTAEVISNLRGLQEVRCPCFFKTSANLASLEPVAFLRRHCIILWVSAPRLHFCRRTFPLRYQNLACSVLVSTAAM